MPIIVAAQTYTILHTDLIWSQRGAVLLHVRRPLKRTQYLHKVTSKERARRTADSATAMFI